MPAAVSSARIDVRTIPPRDRHPLIFTTFDQLAPGQALELVNDHDPHPLRAQFALRAPGLFAWDYLESGPTWRVAITRLPGGNVQPASGGHANGSCCGGCGG